MLDTTKLEKQLIEERYLEDTRETKPSFWERFFKKKKVTTDKRATTKQLLPYVGTVGKDNFIVYKERFVEVLMLQGYNLDTMSGAQLQRLIGEYDTLNRLYVYPFKVLTLHTPTDTYSQQRYYMKLAQKATNPIQKRILMENYHEMKYFAEHENNKEFFIFLYADTLEELQECRTDFLHYKGSLKIYPVPLHKKKAVFFKLNNPMTSVLVNR